MPNVNPADLANAYKHVARVNHYLVGVCFGNATYDDLHQARVLLIEQENNKPHNRTISRALDLLDWDLEQKRKAL